MGNVWTASVDKEPYFRGVYYRQCQEVDRLMPTLMRPHVSSTSAGSILGWGDSPPAQSDDAIKLIKEADRIVIAHREDLQRRPSVIETEGSYPFDDYFEVDSDIPLTIEYLAAQQQEFHSTARRDWIDIDLPPLS